VNVVKEVSALWNINVKTVKTSVKLLQWPKIRFMSSKT